MKQIISTKEAHAWAEALRMELLPQKRAVGEPPAPMKEEHLAAAWKAARKTVKITDALLDGFLTFGLSLLAMLGVAAAAVLLNAPSPMAQATAIAGVGIALARAVARK